jgi:hypothetical protein
MKNRLMFAKFSPTKDSFNKPTPSKWRKIGYTLLTLSGSIAGYMEWFTDDFEYKKIAVGGLVVSGILGKFLTDLFHEE